MLRQRAGWFFAIGIVGFAAYGAACGGSTTTAGAPFDGGATSSSGSTIDATTQPDTGTSPGVPAGKAAFAVNKIFLGETDRAGAKNKDAWKDYGRDIDGLATVVTSSTSPELAKVCKRRAGAPATVHNDGNDGIDNVWGKEIMKLLDPFSPTPSKVMTDAILDGSRTAMISIDGTKGSFLYAESVTPAPTFAPNEERAVAAEWMNGATPIATIVSGAVLSNGTYDSGTLSGDVLVALSADMVVPLHAARITMKLSPDDSSVSDGNISGVVETEVLVNAIAKTAGTFSAELCSGTTIEAIKDSVRQASDIMKDGMQDPSKECDGISVGLGFEATRVVVGATAPAKQPAPDPCQ